MENQVLSISYLKKRSYNLKLINILINIFILTNLNFTLVNLLVVCCFAIFLTVYKVIFMNELMSSSKNIIFLRQVSYLLKNDFYGKLLSHVGGLLTSIVFTLICIKSSAWLNDLTGNYFLLNEYLKYYAFLYISLIIIFIVISTKKFIAFKRA